MLDPTRSEYFGLDPIGRRIWDLLAELIGIASIVAVLRDEYEVDLERCSREVSELIGGLVDAELVDSLPDQR